MKNSLIRVVPFVVALAVMFMATSVNAAGLTWNLGGSDTGYLTSLNVTSGSHLLKVRAYSSANDDGSGGMSRAWVRRYDGGIGVANCISSCTETGSPQHGVDTNGKNDFVLLEFDSVMNAQAFQIGWKNTDADIQIWTGPKTAAADLNLSGVCASGCVNSLSALGFNAVPRFDNVAVGVDKAITALAPSRYVLVSGELGALGAASAGNDYFKLSAFTAGMPLPGTLALFGLALIGMGIHRRRSR